MSPVKQFVCLGLCLGTMSLVQAAEVDPALEDFAFLSGYWVGEGFGGDSEEMWMPPVDGKMMGIFKQSSEGQLIFSEYMEISEVGESFELRLKHFNPDFSGWEEKDKYVTFPFEGFTANKIMFRGLSYEFLPPDQLQVELKLYESDGSSSVEVFKFNRKTL